jgi:hypothetical protein
MTEALINRIKAQVVRHEGLKLNHIALRHVIDISDAANPLIEDFRKLTK